MHPDVPQARRLLRYFHDCYRADNREGSLLDLFAAKVEYRHIIEEPDELLGGKLSKIPVAEPELVEAQARADLYRTEKELRYGTIFLVGHVRGEGRPQRVCAPLLSFPATVEEGPDTPFVAAELTRRRLHYPVLAFVATLFSVDGTAGERLDPVLDNLPEAPFDLAKLGRLADVLNTVFPEVPAEELRLYPEQRTERKLKALRRIPKQASAEVDLRWVFVSAVYLVSRSVDTRGVLSELARLSEGEDVAQVMPLSPPVRAVLGMRAARRKRSHGEQSWRVPAILSSAQRHVLNQARSQPLSLVIGPPGTGKSFTIAALALDALEHGETVLIASKMHHAVDVVADKIEELLGEKGLVIRAGRRQYMKDLRHQIQQLLAGMHRAHRIDGQIMELQRAEIREIEQELTQLEAILADRSQWEQHWGNLEIQRRAARWPLRLVLAARTAWRGRSLHAAMPYWQLMRSYEAATARFVARAADLVRSSIGARQKETLRVDRSSLVRFRKLLTATTTLRKEELFAQIKAATFFAAFPVWLVNLADVSTVLPLIGELFDVVIFDEATQCDIASALPVLQRGRRAVVLGDPHQLRHISFLSRKRQARIAERLELGPEVAERFDYRAKSLLDLVDETIDSQNQVTFLDEHFRSAPPIIAFSNREFYSERLKIMQERPTSRRHAGCLELRFIGGERRDDGANPAEAAAVVEAVRSLLSEEAEHPEAMRHSVGILSPFAAQVELITELLLPQITTGERRIHNLSVGTPYAFQGEERDVMFLSLTVDPGSHSASFRFLERPDVFNVAVTRAKSRQVVFVSVRPGDLGGDSLLRRFLDHVQGEDGPLDRPSQSRGSPDADDPFLAELSAALAARGFLTFPSYPVAGFRLDLVIEREGEALGIDLVGYPGEYAGAFETERYRLWNRAGLRIMPLPYSAWIRSPESCLEAVEATHRRGIERRRGRG